MAVVYVHMPFFLLLLGRDLKIYNLVKKNYNHSHFLIQCCIWLSVIHLEKNIWYINVCFINKLMYHFQNITFSKMGTLASSPNKIWNNWKGCKLDGSGVETILKKYILGNVHFSKLSPKIICQHHCVHFKPWLSYKSLTIT